MIVQPTTARRLWLVPVTRDEALSWIRATHRTHASRPPGYRFAVGVAGEDGLHGVALVGHPVARELAKDKTAFEVTRVATDGTPQRLLDALWRVLARRPGARLPPRRDVHAGGRERREPARLRVGRSWPS